MWIARDKDKTLCVYTEKPERDKSRNWWTCTKSDQYCVMSSDLFPEITWDSEPVECFINTGFDMARQLNQIWGLVKCLQDENAKLRVSTNLLLEKMQAINKIVNG